MKFTYVSPHIDLCRSSSENQERYISAQKEQIQLQLNIFISWQLSLFSSYWVQRLREKEHKQLYWFTPMSYIQSSPNPRWNLLNHNSNNYKHHCSWTLQEHDKPCWKTLFQHTQLFKKLYQEEFTTTRLQVMKYETNTPDRGCRNLP